jgi:energy-coupling factor transporter ATP-binding protein EcfA2
VLTEADWLSKYVELTELFSPTHPIRELELFAGRQDQIMRLVETVFQAGQHAIIYGDRGVGKTSLSITLRQKVFPVSERVRFFETKCFKEDSFADIWARAFDEHVWEDKTYALDGIDDTLDPYTIRKMMRKFPVGALPVFVFDEFDRIEDKDTRLKMSETIKIFSDELPGVTLILVGIGRTIRDLLDDHQSVRRALRQIEMPRMTGGEISELIKKRLGRVGMDISDAALVSTIVLCRGMPGYAHLLGLHSAKAAVHEERLLVDEEHLWNSLKFALNEAEDIVKQDYQAATQSAQPGNQLKQALLACSLADLDEFGCFTATAVREPFSRIMQAQKDIPDFNRHLNAFCTKERGNILERYGSAKNYRYKFRDVMMQCYVAMRGVSDGIIERDELASSPPLFFPTA